MKKILLVASFTLSFSSAIAGSLAYIAPEVTAIEEPARMGGSGAWIIPLVIVAVLALALTKESTQNSCDAQSLPATGGSNLPVIVKAC